MAAPSYDSDLTLANGGLITDAVAITNWDESTDGAWDDGGGPVAETDFYIQGTSCVSAQFTKTGVGTLIYNYGAGFTLPADGAFLIWCFWASPPSLATYAAGGVRTLVGTSFGDFNVWQASGSDFEPNPYGGWYNYALDPNQTVHTTLGTPGAAYQYIGMAINATAQARGQPFAVDSIRGGRCESRFTDGDIANGYATIAGFASADGAATERWALLQEISGGYRWQGLMVLGHGTAVDFRDSNRNIVVANTPMSSVNFNKIEVRQTGSRVDWTNFNITATGTQSPGDFEAIDNADINKETCVFTDMGYFIYQTLSTINNSTFRRCEQITQGGGTFDGCIIDLCVSPIAMVVANAVVSVTNTSFISDGTGYGMEGFSTAASYDLVGITFSNYAGADGITGNEAIHVLATSGTVTLNISGGGNTPSIHTEGATVNVVAGAVTIKATTVTSAGIPIENARVLLKASDATGPFPYQESITITRSGSVATVSHTGHGMSTNDYTAISGANQAEYNGVKLITVIDANSYSFTVVGTPASPATGTIITTFVALYGLTDVNGEISTSRVYGADQPVAGWTRKSTSSPFYQEGLLTGSVTTSAGFDSTAVMISDE